MSLKNTDTLKTLKERLSKTFGIGACQISKAYNNRGSEFEKEMHSLKVVLNKDVNGNEDLENLIHWYINEYNKRPELHKGDALVVITVRQLALKGLSFKSCIEGAYEVLRNDLKNIDALRQLGL
jgi:hypothetical protein